MAQSIICQYNPIFLFTVIALKAEETTEEPPKADETSEDKMKTANECKEQEKATDEDLQAFTNHKLQQTQTGKCLMACIYEKNGGVCVPLLYSKNFLC